MLNGTPLLIDPAEVYTSLQTGLITGISYSMRSKFPEVVKVMVPVATHNVTNPVVVNNNSWNALPKDIRDTIMNYFESRQDWYETGSFVDDGLLIQEAFEKYGLVVKPAPAFRKELRTKAYEGIWKLWIDRVGPGGAISWRQ